MINFLQNKGLYKTSLIKVFDGFMIFKNDLKGVDIDLLLIDLEKEVFIKTNYKIKLEVKPMIKIIDVPEDYEMKNTNENLDNVNPIKNDLDGALQILQKLEGKIYKCKDILYYKHDNKWITDLKLIHDLLKSFIIDAEFVKYKKATKKDILEGEDIIQILGVDYCLMKFEHYSTDNTGATNILNVLLSKIPINGTLIQKILNSSKQKIFFNNGYFDFKKMEFINNFDGVETMVKIEREFVERNIEDEGKVLNLIFKPIFNEDVNEALLFFSRALAGEVVDKLWGIMLGSRDAGKGVNQDAIIAAFQDYIKSFNANSLILDKTGGDAAKKLSWAYDFDKHRLAFSNEMKIDNSIVIDGNLIKQLCSGGDAILTRKNNIDEKGCIPQATVCFCCNDIPKIEPSDVYEKLIPFSLKSTFIDEEITEDLLKENPYYKKGDNALRDMVKNEEWIINAVTNLIIFSYKPYKVKLNENMSGHLESFKTGECIWDKLNEDFEITRNDKDKVMNKIMKDYIKGNEILISFPKIVNLYMAKGINNKPYWDINKTVRGFIGLKKINRFEKEEDDYLKSHDI